MPADNPTTDYDMKTDFAAYQTLCSKLSKTWSAVVDVEDELKHRYGVNWQNYYEAYLYDRKHVL